MPDRDDRSPSAAEDAARTAFAHARGALDASVLRRLRRHLEEVEAERQARAASEREQRAIARGESADALRLDPVWFDVFCNPSTALLTEIGSATWVVYPPQVRSVRCTAHHVPWHQDVGYQRLLGGRGHGRHVTCFVPLDDDPAARPTIEFACAAVPELEHVARDGFGAGLADTPAGERTHFALALGDALVFGDLVPHRTFVPYPERPERRSLEFRLVRPCDAVAGKDYFDVLRGSFTRRTPSVEVA